MNNLEKKFTMSAGKIKNGTNEKYISVKKTRFLYFFIISFAIIILIIFYFFIPNMLGNRENSTTQLRQMRRLVSQIGRLETEVQKKRKALLNFLKEYGNKTGKPLPSLSALGLSNEEKEGLKEKIVRTNDIDTKELIKKILDKDIEISEIEGEINRYDTLLPTPYIVIGQEAHYEIAMDFLVNKKKVEKDEALRMIERVALFDPLKPGFRVWNFYSGGGFVTFITQGTAEISPNEHRRLAKQFLINARDKATVEVERLTEEIKLIGTKREKIISEVMQLRKEKKQLEEQLTNLSGKNIEMQRIINSLFYMVDKEDNLIKKSVIKRGGFLGLGSLKLKRVPLEKFKEKIDLRIKKIIEIYAGQFNLSEINGITLYPKFYKKDVDYKIEIEKNKQKAVLTILAGEKFKTGRIVISVK